MTAAAFVSDTLRVGSRVTINPGLRFDHSRAISQDVPEFDANGDDTGEIIDGRGTVDTWNTVSPRLGVVIKLDAAGRTMLRANAGRFSQGVLTGEISTFHPGRTTSRPSRNRRASTLVRDPRQVQLDPEIRAAVHGSGTRSAWIARSAVGSRYPPCTSARTAATSSDGRKSLVSIAKSRPPLADGRTVQVFKLTSRSERSPSIG